MKLKLRLDVFARERVRKGMTTGEVADLIGISRQALYLITSGKGNPSPKTAMKLVEALKVELEQLFDIVE